MIDSPQIESHLQEIYTVLASNVTINEKLNALIYFESIIDNSNVSNRLINSAFVQLLVKLLKSVKSPGVKQRLCSVLGLLVRHSTVIDNELAESEICSTLVEVMEERSEKVRRRAIAALGEYMFYAATQLDEDNFDPDRLPHSYLFRCYPNECSSCFEPHLPTKTIAFQCCI